MEPPKNDNVVFGFVQRLKEKANTELIKKLTAALVEADDFETLKVSVMNIISNIYENMSEIISFYEKVAIQQMNYSNAFFFHTHDEEGDLKFPEGISPWGSSSPEMND